MICRQTNRVAALAVALVAGLVKEGSGDTLKQMMNQTKKEILTAATA